jgi:putative ABC transport system permease protein
MQRLRLRSDEYFVAWALGARRRQFASRLMGEMAPRIGVVVVLGLWAAVLVPAVIQASFPGAASGPGASLAPMIVIAVLLSVSLNIEMHAGDEARHRFSRGISVRKVLSNSVTIIALSFAALSGVGLVVENTRYLGDTTPALDDVHVVEASLGAVSPGSRGSVLESWQTESRQHGAPVGIASAGTMRGTGVRENVWVDCGRCFEGGLPLPFRTVWAEVHAVAPDTFQFFGLELVAGREFDPGRDVGSPNVAVVSEALANRHFEDGRALGRGVRVGDSQWLTVVGIVSDRADRNDQRDYSVYLPIAQAAPTEIEMFVSAMPAARAAVIAATPDGAVVRGMRVASEVFSTHAWFRSLMSVLGVAGLVLVGIGLRVAAANEAQDRIFELALRKGLGARRSHLIKFIVTTATRQLMFGIGAGAWLSLFLGAALHEASGAIPMMDLKVWMAVGLFLTLVFSVGYLPRFRAALRVAPLEGMLQSGVT